MPAPQPVAPALEGIRRQPHGPRAAALEDGLPVHLGPVHPGRAQRAEEASRPALPAAQRADDPDRRRIEQLSGGLRGLPHPDRQHRVRADLDERPLPSPSSARTTRSNCTVSRRLRYQYSASSSAVSSSPPVTREWNGTSPLCGAIPAHALQQLLADLLYLHRVRGVVHRHPRARTPCAAHAASSSASACRVAGDHHRGGPVDRRERDPLPQRLKQPVALPTPSASETIPPRPASADSARLRSATIFAASSSDRPPAT